MSVRIASIVTSDEFVSIRNGRYLENWVATLTVRSWPNSSLLGSLRKLLVSGRSRQHAELAVAVDARRRHEEPGVARWANDAALAENGEA